MNVTVSAVNVQVGASETHEERVTPVEGPVMVRVERKSVPLVRVKSVWEPSYVVLKDMMKLFIYKVTAELIVKIFTLAF